MEKVKLANLFLVAFLALIALIVVFCYKASEYIGINEKANFATYFGGIAGLVTLFISFITLLLLWHTYRLQKEELHKTSQALAEQLINSDIERVENISFKLLELYHKSLNEYKYVTALPILQEHSPGTDSILMYLRDLRPNDLFVFSNASDRISLFGEYRMSISKDEFHYSILKNITYKFIAIYKTIFHLEQKYSSLIDNQQLDYLRFAINNQISPAEFVAIKTVIFIEEDLHELIPKFKRFSIVINEENIMHELSLL